MLLLTLLDLDILNPHTHWASLDLLSLALLARTCRGMREVVSGMLEEECAKFDVRSEVDEKTDSNPKIIKHIRGCEWLVPGYATYTGIVFVGKENKNFYSLYNEGKNGVRVHIMYPGGLGNYTDVRIKELRNRTGCAMWVVSSNVPGVPFRMSWACLREWLRRYV